MLEVDMTDVCDDRLKVFIMVNLTGSLARKKTVFRGLRQSKTSNHILLG